MQTPETPTLTSHKVAVIGAGAAGLVAARELQREGHQVVVFEQNSRVGGIWVYSSDTESDPLGIDPSRKLVHTSLYNSLGANLPRELIGFRDFPFTVKEGNDRDPRRFPGHQEFAHYLTDFMNEFALSEFIRFETEVVLVKLIHEARWVVRSRKINGDLDDEKEEFFNAVVVCNGHYAKPNVAEIPGIDAWPGQQIHSHNYRVPNAYRNKIVILIGSAASGYDISREIATVAKEVHIASRKNTNKSPTKIPEHDNMWLHSMIKGAHEDGTLVFQDGSTILADIIVHCTGYKYNFPFLETGIVTIGDRRVSPLYQHIFPPSLAPWLSFIGIPFMVVSFRLFEMQSTWVARILSGKSLLPSEEEMMSYVDNFYSELESAGVPERYTHMMAESQFEYVDRLAAHGQFPPLEEWRKPMYMSIFSTRATRSENYRDEWEEEELITQAHKEFLQYTANKCTDI